MQPTSRTTALPSIGGFTPWLAQQIPEYTWDWSHLIYIRQRLAQITRREIDRLMIAIPPQHAKTRSVTVPYPVWRMLREPGLRTGIVSHTQRYADKISRWIRKLAIHAGGVIADVNRVDQWELTNGSSFIARGVGASIAGEPLDLCMLDDVFGSREDADSPTKQETVYEWYMDDVTPRLQKNAAIVGCNTRWGPGDLFGRILESEEGPEWTYIRLPAIAEEDDPLGRAKGVALCEDRFPLAKLEQKRRIEGIGFESLYQQNPIVRGGSFFRREWFEVVESLPVRSDPPVRIRYWDLASSRKDSACFTAGVLMAKVGDVMYVEDVVRDRWSPAERNNVMLDTAKLDALRPGFLKTYFESPVFDTGQEARRSVLAKLAGYPVRADEVSGSKEVRAEPLADAAMGGFIKLVAASWTAAYLTEIEGFPKVKYKDQVDSSSGAYNMHTRGQDYIFV